MTCLLWLGTYACDNLETSYINSEQVSGSINGNWLTVNRLTSLLRRTTWPVSLS